MSMSILLGISLLVLLWMYFLWSRRRMYRLMLQIPGPFGYPLLGAFPRLWCNCALEVIGDDMRRWGTTFLSWFGPLPVLAVGDPQTAQELLSSPYTVNKSSIGKNVLAEILGHSLAIVHEPLWSIHRRALNPVFGHHNVLSSLNIFNAETRVLLVELDQLVGKGEQNPMMLFRNFTLRTAAQTAMGSDIRDEEIYKNQSLMKGYQNLISVFKELALAPWLNIRFLRYFYGYDKILVGELSNIRALIRKLIYKKLNGKAMKTDPNKSETKSQIFIDQVIDQFKNRVLSYEDIESESHTIIMAAFESSALSTYYTLMLLAMFPEYQEKVFEELKVVFPDSGHFDVSYDDIQKLTYLDMVINESMRLMPVLPFTLRQLSEDVKLSNGIVLPKDLHIGICIYHIHRNKEIWGPQADTFNPDNCLPQNLLDLHPYAFIPFFKGKRNCIGWRYAILTLKVALAKLLRNYKFTTSFPFENLQIVNNLFLKFKEEPCLELQRRT